MDLDTTATAPLGHVAHFAINCDDLAASRRFYEATFGWRFEPWGPPDFFHILTADGSRPGAIGAIQARRALGGHRPVGFECTVAVPDVAAVTAAARSTGGEVLMDATTIAGVGELVFILDPSGNPVGAMRYDGTAT